MRTTTSLASLRWGTLLLKRMSPILDWYVVLAYARHSDPAAAEYTLARMRSATTNTTN